MSIYAFRNVVHYGQALFSEQLETSVISWLRWGLLGIGAFQSVTRSTVTPYGDLNASLVRVSTDPRFTARTVCEGARSDWVWETGIEYTYAQPEPVAVYVNGSLHATNSGTYPHHVDYPKGRVVFNSPLPAGATVEVAHSYMFVQVHPAETPWFRELQFRSMRTDEGFLDAAETPWDLLPEHRVQLPALVVEVPPEFTVQPYEIGSGNRVHRQAVNVHCLAETPWDRRRLTDLVITQWQHRVQTFDKDAATLPLDHRGSPVAGAKTYPQLCAAWPWVQARLVDVRGMGAGDVGRKLWWATVRVMLEMDLA